MSADESLYRDVTVWTLDARDFLLLDVMAASLALTDAQFRREITGAHAATVEALATKSINYADLRNPLVPQKDRREIALFFLADEGGYGSAPGSAADCVLGLLPPDLRCAVLRGDLLAKDQDWAFEVLQGHLVGHRPVDIRHTSQIYAIYLNNLSSAMFRSVAEGARSCSSYVGFADCTFGSPMKDWLSRTLSSTYLKVGRTFVNGHEDDASADDDYDLPGWPLERHGFTYRSIQGTYFSLFLAYKIERRVLPGEADSRFALAAVSNEARALRDMDVVVEDKKLGYLRENKLGVLTSAGLQEASSDVLQSVIQERIEQSYLYEMQYQSRWGTSQFNVMMEMSSPNEGSRRRVKAVLSYEPRSNSLRLISLY
jgi:hypothetical protein